MKLYLAGPMTGYPNYNWPAFDAAAQYWRSHGHEVINPAEMDRQRGVDPTVPATHDKWLEAMRHDIAVLAGCDGIVLLPDWEHSRGANIEFYLARALGLRIVNHRDHVAS